MANTMTGERLARPSRARAAGMTLALPPWHRLALAGILLLAPATWAVVTVRNAPGGMLPGAGPAQAGMIDGLRVMDGPGGPGVPARGPRGDGLDRADRKLLEYLLANQGDARFLERV